MVPGITVQGLSKAGLPVKTAVFVPGRFLCPALQTAVRHFLCVYLVSKGEDSAPLISHISSMLKKCQKPYKQRFLALYVFCKC